MFQNCITPHAWSSRADRLDRPDKMIFDLDPARGDGDWPLVTRTARELIALLQELGATPFAMTSGSRGVHVVVALRRSYGFDLVQAAAHAIAGELVARRPDDLTRRGAGVGARLLVARRPGAPGARRRPVGGHRARGGAAAHAMSA